MVLKNLRYSIKNLNFIMANTPSEFDSVLKSSWQTASDSGLFKYKLDSSPNIVRQTFNDFDFLILTIPGRFGSRRKPLLFENINEMQKLGHFNFTTVIPDEVLFTVKFDNIDCTGYVLPNISPFMFCHALLVPDPFKLYNQVIGMNSLSLALYSMLISSESTLCLGFNSLLAYASVNHLHYHFWYSVEQLYAAKCPLVKKSKFPGYYQLLHHPVENFVFEFSSTDDCQKNIQQLWTIINWCQQIEIAHNLFAARNVDGILRVVLWLRRSVHEVKSTGIACESDNIETQLTASRGYNIAVAELAGMLVVSNESVSNMFCRKGYLEEILVQERLQQSKLEELIKNISAI